MSTTEKVAVVRRNTGHEVSVTVREDEITVNHKVRLMGPTPASVARAVQECRSTCATLLEGVKGASA